MIKRTTFIVAGLLLFVQVWCQTPRSPLYYPLHAELTSAPNIINDGKSNNSFTIGIFNTDLPDGTDSGNFVFPAGKPVRIWFVVSSTPANQTPDRPWGLTSSDLLYDKSTSVSVGPGTWTVVPDQPDLYLKRPDLMGWKATPSKDVTLAPGEQIQFSISGLKSALPDGYTTPYFFYSKDKYPKTNYNFVTYGPVLKTPAVARFQSVGVGTDNPQAQVHIKSDNSTKVILEMAGGTNGWAQYHLLNGSSDWMIGTSRDWMGNMLYFSEASHQSKAGFNLSPEGNIGAGMNPGAFRLGLVSSGTYSQPDWNAYTLFLAPDLNLVGSNLIGSNLIKFGGDGDYQFKHLNNSQTIFKKPTLALNAGTGQALGFFNGNQSNLEVDAEKGNAYLRGNLSLGNNPDSDVPLKVGRGDQYGETMTMTNSAYQTHFFGKAQRDGVFNSMVKANDNGITWDNGSQNPSNGFVIAPAYGSGGNGIRIDGSSGEVLINGTVRFANNQAVFQTKRIQSGDITEDRYTTHAYDTGFSMKDYIVIVAGYQINDMDVNENAHTYWGMNINPGSNGNWELDVQVASQEDYNYYVDVLAINVKLLGGGKN